MNVAPNTVSGRVVKTGMKRSAVDGDPSGPVVTAKRISAPSLLPIQFAWAFFVDSDQSIQDRLASSRSAYRVIRKNHCDKSRCVTVVPHRSHAPAITCSLARTVWQEGHQLTAATSFSARPDRNSCRKCLCVNRTLTGSVDLVVW